MTANFENKGARIIGERPADLEHSERQVIVLGVGRGGTSAVAGTLFHLGLYMGKSASSPIYEDPYLFKPMEAKKEKQCAKIIAGYSGQNKIWGFKRASMPEYAETYHNVFSNPLYIVIFRDLAAIASRAEISGGDDFVGMLDRQYNQYGLILQFLRKNQPHSLVLSYEKFLSDPATNVKYIADFCALNPTEKQLKSAIEFVAPSPTDYVKNTRVERTLGRLGGNREKTVFGWARYSHKEDVTTVELIVNGKLVGETKANIVRTGLGKIKKGGACAYEFQVSELKKGDEIRVRAKGDGFDLNNSPCIAK